MEHIDIDQMLEVPDTPDRHVIGRESVGQESNSSFSGGSEHTNFLHENPIRGLRGRGLFTENGHNRRSNICPPKSVKKLKIKDYEETNDVNPLGNPFASQNARSVQVSMDRSSSHGSRYSTGARNLDKGKTICTRVSSNPSPLQEGSKCFNLSKPKGHTQFPKMVCSHGFDVEVQNMNKRKVASDGCSSVSCIPDSLQGKIQENGFNCASPPLTHREGSIPADSFQHETREELSVPQSVSSHRGSRKRLVKNGLICPVNIERVKRSAEQHNSSSRDVGQSQVGNQLNGSSCHLDISNIVAAKNNSERVKDKNVLNHHSASKERLENLDHASSSGSGKGDGKTNVTGDASIDVYRCSEGLGDWRRTHNHSRNPDFHSPDIASSLCKGIDAVGSFAHRQQESGLGGSHSDFGDNCMNECDDARNQNAGQSAIRLGSELEFPYRPLCVEKTNAKRQKKQGLSSRNGERSTSTFVENVSQSAVRLGPELELPYGPLCAEKTNAKRQKKQGLSSRNGECSTSTFVDPDVVFLGSSGESSMSRSSRVPIRLSHDISCPIYEVDELSPAVRSNVPQHLDLTTNNDLNAMARQVEADEVLARELQEQLYYEEPVVGGGEIDEHVARALQEVENGVLTSSGNQNQSNDRGLLASHLYRQPRSRSSQNSSSRRGSQGRVPNSTRMAQLRGRHHRQSPVLSRRARNLRFPADMALDMRIDILEALEAAVGNFSDGETDNLAFEVQHDFNENDYEMLLALDENNHQHAGASVHQINSLPQSTVQSDIHQETCAVCLETPTIGEIVRHLPCLHKFHKDCIDPWLSRKTSCPVCKSSIT